MAAYQMRDMLHPLTNAVTDLCVSRGSNVEDGLTIICAFDKWLPPPQFRTIIDPEKPLSMSIQNIFEALDPSAREQEKDICYQVAIILAQYIRDWVHFKPYGRLEDLKEELINGCYGAITRLNNGVISAEASDPAHTAQIQALVCQRFAVEPVRVIPRPQTQDLRVAKGEIVWENHVPRPPSFSPPPPSPQ